MRNASIHETCHDFAAVSSPPRYRRGGPMRHRWRDAGKRRGFRLVAVCRTSGGSATSDAGPFALSRSGIKRSSRAATAIPCRDKLPCPSSLLLGPRLRSLTASRGLRPGDALKIPPGVARKSDTFERHPRGGGDPVTLVFGITGK